MKDRISYTSFEAEARSEATEEGKSQGRKSAPPPLYQGSVRVFVVDSRGSGDCIGASVIEVGRISWQQ